MDTPCLVMFLSLTSQIFLVLTMKTSHLILSSVQLHLDFHNQCYSTSSSWYQLSSYHSGEHWYCQTLWMIENELKFSVFKWRSRFPCRQGYQEHRWVLNLRKFALSQMWISCNFSLFRDVNNNDYQVKRQRYWAPLLARSMSGWWPSIMGCPLSCTGFNETAFGCRISPMIFSSAITAPRSCCHGSTGCSRPMKNISSEIATGWCWLLWPNDDLGTILWNWSSITRFLSIGPMGNPCSHRTCLTWAKSLMKRTSQPVSNISRYSASLHWPWPYHVLFVADAH